MAYSLKLSWIGKCPKRHRYNPEDGPTFHAGCQYCQKLYRIWQAEQKLRKKIEAYEEAVEAKNGGFELR